MYSLNVNTITNAQRAVKLLNRIGVTSYISREKNYTKRKGCGYTVELYSENIEAVKEYLLSMGISIYGVDIL